MVNKTKSIELNSTKDNMSRVEKFVEEICDEFNVFNNYFGNILIAISEAVENAIIHGNNNETNKLVKIKFESKPEGLLFSIEDEGQGYDFDNPPDPTDLEQKGEKGRGLFLMNKLSDGISFDNNGNIVNILFKISCINFETSVERAKQLNLYIKNVTAQEHSNL